MFRFVRGRVRLLFFPGFIIFYAEKSNRLWGGILLEIIIITFTTCFFFLCLRVDPGKRARCPTTVVRLAFLLLLEQRLTVVHRSAVKPDRFYLKTASEKCPLAAAKKSNFAYRPVCIEACCAFGRFTKLTVMRVYLSVIIVVAPGEGDRAAGARSDKTSIPDRSKRQII